MKKLFTIDDFIVGFISAIGYDLSFEIPKVLDLENWKCELSSMVIGTAIYFFARKIIFDKTVQKNSVIKKLVFGASVIIFFYRAICFTEIKRLIYARFYLVE